MSYHSIVAAFFYPVCGLVRGTEVKKHALCLLCRVLPKVLVAFCDHAQLDCLQYNAVASVQLAFYFMWMIHRPQSKSLCPPA